MTQWLPVLSSLIVAGAALIGFAVNNRTNRRAIEAADERHRETLEEARRGMELAHTAGERREHDKWRHEAVVAAVSSVLETSNSVRQQLWSCHRWEVDDNFELEQVGADIHEALWGCNGTINRLRLLASPKIPNQCEDLLSTLGAARNITLQYLKLQLDDEATSEEFTEINSLWEKAIRKAIEQERAVVNATRAELGIERLEDVAKPARQPVLDPA
ncbi:hypothetical protein [Nocardia farcinica]|uniref:hypothetical protein n=1 Tax=Nocardia farcinica TaxID=37329 RepID=UPI002457F3B1|nr:hypothetical protein [Nocardia farcinica]